jgi:hypothetical protein
MMPPDRFLRLTVAVIVTALTGLIVVQVMLLKDAFALKQETFRQSVSGALSAAAVRLATGETQDVVFRTEKDSLNRTISAGSSAWSVSGECTVPPGPQARRDSLAHRDGTPSLMRIQVITTGDKDSLLLDSSRLAGRRARPAGTPAAAAQGFMYRYETDSVKTVVRVGGDVSRTILTHSGNDRRRQVFVARVIDNLRVSSRRPLEDRISRSAVDSALRRSFTEAGITLEYASGVLDRDDSLHFAQPHEASQDLHMSPYRTALFLDDGPQNRLVVSFPGQRLFLLQQLWPVLLASLVFLVLIVAGFAAGFRTIVRQHQLGRSMVDFINNMTH